MVYWLADGADEPIEESVTIEVTGDVLRCDGGIFPIPSDIRKKIILEATLSEEDRRVMTSVKMAQQIEDTPGTLLFDAPPDYELYGLVPQENAATTKRLPQVNEKISIFWKRDNTYYPGFVSKRRGDFFMIRYNDGDEEWLPLTDHRFQLFDPPQFVDESCESYKMKPKRKSTGSETSTQSNSSSGTLNPALLVRTNSEGCIAPTKPPKRNSAGRFLRPQGRKPNGYTWNSRRGVWVQAISSDSGTTDESPSMDEPVAKRPKKSSVVSKEESPVETTSTGEPSSDFKGSRTESLVGYIISTFDCVVKGKPIENCSGDSLDHAEGVLNELIAMDLNVSTLSQECPRIFKVVKKLASNSRLGPLAKTLYSKMMVAFDRKLIVDWGTAIEERNLFSVTSKVQDLKSRMQQKKFGLKLPAKHITNEELQALVTQTDRLMEVNESELTEMDFIKSVMNYRCVKLES